LSGEARPVGAAPPRTARSGLIARYMLQLLSRPLLATLLVVLPTLLLERLLRLFDLVASGSAARAVVQLVLYLAPHYFGLALPAALFISVFVVVSQLSANHELDAIQGSGISLARVSRPFLMVGLLLTLVGIGLYGYLQPLSRYAYRAAFHAVTHSGWNATVTPGEFTRLGRNLSLTADGADLATGQLTGIFVQQHRADGADVTTTAPAGWLLPPAEENKVVLRLEGGTQIIVHPNGEVETLSFGDSAMARPFTLDLAPFRIRGEDERELTLDELWKGRQPAGPAISKTRLEGELHARLVRSASMLVLPLLAVPMGLAAKRTRRWHGIALAGLIVVFYHYAIQLAESLGDIGKIQPKPVLWAIFAAFTLFCSVTFVRAGRHPSEGPFDGMLGALERLGEILGSWLPRRRRRGAT
jgi:lipopolysaccharide export system permease protein